jgi:DNA-binding response OmpR family regulator
MILVLDDEPWFLQGYLVALQFEGFTAKIVEEEKAFFEALETDSRVTAAVIDVMLSSGESSGLQVLSLLRGMNKELPVIMLTNRQDMGQELSPDGRTAMLFKRDADPIVLVEKLKDMGVRP